MREGVTGNSCGIREKRFDLIIHLLFNNAPVFCKIFTVFFPFANAKLSLLLIFLVPVLTRFFTNFLQFRVTKLFNLEDGLFSLLRCRLPFRLSTDSQLFEYFSAVQQFPLILADRTHFSTANSEHYNRIVLPFQNAFRVVVVFAKGKSFLSSLSVSPETLRNFCLT